MGPSSAPAVTVGSLSERVVGESVNAMLGLLRSCLPQSR